MRKKGKRVVLASNAFGQATALQVAQLLDTLYKVDKDHIQSQYYRVSQKSKPQTFVHLCQILTDFQNFFQRRILWKICNKMVTKHTTIP